jgi:hypothetical protein
MFRLSDTNTVNINCMFPLYFLFLTENVTETTQKFYEIYSTLLPVHAVAMTVKMMLNNCGRVFVWFTSSFHITFNGMVFLSVVHSSKFQLLYFMILERKATISWVRMGTYDVTSTPVKLTGMCRASVHITYIFNHCFLFGKQGSSTCEAKQVTSSHF